MMKVTLPLVRNVSETLTTTKWDSLIDGAIQWKMRVKGVIRTIKGILFVTSDKNMNDLIRVIKWLQNSGVLIDGFSETAKLEMKNKKVDFSVCN